MKLITIKGYYSEIEAQLAKKILEENGIKSVIKGRDSIRMAHYSLGIEVQIKEEDVEKATKILKEAEGKIK